MLPAGDPLGGAQAFVAVFVEHHENIGRGGLDGASELLRGYRRVDQVGEREDRYASNVFEPELFVRSFNVGGVLGRGSRGGGGGEVDR